MKLIFRGFKHNFGHRPARTFLQKMDTIEQNTGGRVIYRIPIDAADNWYDWQGVSHPRPLVAPGNDNLLLEVQLNSSRVFVTSHRLVFIMATCN